MLENQPRLTELVSCAGCAAKLSPGILSAAVQDLFRDAPRDPHVLVGYDTLDDAGVYRLSETQALVQTVDFITPVVDDPFTYGQIAAANALSDIWAMGGQPLTALNVTCFPSSLDPGILNAILRGGLAKLTEGGAALLGGHTIDDPEIKYGAAITGLIDPQRILSNAGAQAGDALVLTKPIGVGIITTGIKDGLAGDDSVQAAIGSMTMLNRSARDAMLRHHAHACTDVTGFSLLGHLTHMARESQVTARIEAARVPILPGALALRRQGVGPGGLDRNRDYFGTGVRIESAAEQAQIDLLFDPQTSGGLLIALPKDSAPALLADLMAQGLTAARVGEIIPREDALIVVG
jgi:selenide,water dikinase